MSHLSTEACTQRLAAGRGDGYPTAAATAAAIARLERPSAGRTCCASCGSSGEAASKFVTTQTTDVLSDRRLISSRGCHCAYS